MRHLRALIIAMIASAMISGCAGTKPLIPIEQTIPVAEGKTSVTIIAPQEQYLPAQAYYASTDYDYFLDCIEETCKIGRMRVLQYITISPTAGKHTLFIKLAPDGIMETVALVGADPLSIPFESAPDKRVFISHAFETSVSSLLLPIISSPTASLSVIDEKAGHEKIQKILSTTSFLGNKHGERGITY